MRYLLAWKTVCPRCNGVIYEWWIMNRSRKERLAYLKHVGRCRAAEV